MPEDLALPRRHGVDRAEAGETRGVLGVGVEELHEVIHDVRLGEYVRIVPGETGGESRPGRGVRMAFGRVDAGGARDDRIGI